MPAVMIRGSEIAKTLRTKLGEEVAVLATKGIVPTLGVVLVGDDPGSLAYVESISNACGKLGIWVERFIRPAETTQEQLETLIQQLSDTEAIHGVLLQLPLPTGLDPQGAIAKLSPKKDVDGVTRANTGGLLVGEYQFVPCTPGGIMRLIETTGVGISGKHCVVLGRSPIVGMPVAMLLLHAHGTVTICHSRTKDLKEICKQADILVVAIGRAGFVTGDMIKPGAVVIDVGTNRSPEGKLCGDVAFDQVSQVAGFLTPVPGGVGPMTVTMLMAHTIEAAQRA